MLPMLGGVGDPRQAELNILADGTAVGHPIDVHGVFLAKQMPSRQLDKFSQICYDNLQQVKPVVRAEGIPPIMQTLTVIPNAIISLVLVKLLYLRELVAVGRDPM